MCGINGIFGLSDTMRSKELIVKMNCALAHRGPDDEGVFTDHHIALGHRRLSIIDLSSAGHQPMSISDGRYTIVYNGELYNYRSIRTQIGDHTFTTNTDTEVILAAFQKWGKSCLQQFNGMFSFAIWDKLKKELFIARDRLGIKPLYYFRKDDKFIFSSELRSILKSGLVPKKLDRKSLADYLRYQTVHAPDTIIKDIHMLMPGNCITIGEDKYLLEQYWNGVDNAGKHDNLKSYEEVCKEVKQLLFKSVERRLIADVPFGAFLSGGIDSSAIVGLMSEVSNGPVKTFTVSFDEEEFSEAKYAAMIAKKFGTEHHEIKLNANDFLNELPGALKALDHPSGDGPNTYVVSKVTRKSGITMALSGLGGDELFAGYDVFKRMYKIHKNKWISRFPSSIREIAGLGLKTFKPGMASDKLAELLKLQHFNLSHTYPLSRQVLLDRQVGGLLDQSILPRNVVAQMVNEQLELGTKGYELPFLSRVTLAEVYSYMQNVLLRDTDQMSMAHALEVRVPFLDHQLFEYVTGIPDQYKYPHTPKKLLVDALGNLLPSEIVNRPKMGFTFPWKHWLKNELSNFCEKHISHLASRAGFNKKAVLMLWQRFLKDDPGVTWSRVWYLVVLENWLIENQIED